MDSLTHIVLGACIGEAVAGKRLGKRALFLGAIAQSIPDIDFLGALWLSESDNLIAHRGITHSLLFGIFATVVLVFFTKHYFRRRHIGVLTWVLLFGINIFTHIFIDSFNAYGTGWFEPFSHRRVSFHTIFVADPLFSLWPFIACIGLTFMRMNDNRRPLWWKSAVAICSVYLVYTIINKLVIDSSVRATLQTNQLSQANYFTTPSPFNSFLWYVVIRGDSGYYVGYHSVFDDEKTIDLSYFPRNDSLLREVKDREEVEDLKSFAENFYTVEKWNDTLVFNVLRFGQVVGWHDPKERFVFHYFLDRPGANDLVTQRGRFMRWDRKTVGSLFDRIRGDDD